MEICVCVRETERNRNKETEREWGGGRDGERRTSERDRKGGRKELE